MMRTTFAIASLVLWLSCPWGLAQILVEQEVRAPLQNIQTVGALVPPLVPATTVELILDDTSDGEGVIDILVTDPGVAVSLILPGAVEVTAVNAASLGFVFDVYTVADQDTSLAVSPLLMPGTHIVIKLAPGLTPGTYQVKADSSAVAAAVAAESGLLATYYSSLASVWV